MAVSSWPVTLHIVMKVEPEICQAAMGDNGKIIRLMRKDLAKRLKKARFKVKRRFYRTGATPYGRHPNFPEETVGLELMKSLRGQGTIFRVIAEELTKRKFPTPRGVPGKAWNPVVVRQILNREGVR